MSQEKTEAPTPRRLRKLREQGEVWRSNDLTGAAALAAALAILWQWGAGLIQSLMNLLVLVFTVISKGGQSHGEVLKLAWQLLCRAMTDLVPMVLCMAIVPTCVSFLQVGVVFAPRRLSPRLDRLNPAAGLQRIFLSSATWFELLKNLLKAISTAAVAWWVLKPGCHKIPYLVEAAPEFSAWWAIGMAGQCALGITVLHLSIGTIDVWQQRRQFLKRNRMSSEEVRREIEDDEGKAEHRAERKRLHRDIAEGAMLEAANEADVLLINPTHIACALRFDPAKDRAPRLLAKGKGHLATRLRKLARQRKIPIVQNIGVARALWALELNTVIPEALYEAVKHVLLYVERAVLQQGRRPAWLDPAAANSPSLATGNGLPR